jgi:hypothetical protein
MAVTIEDNGTKIKITSGTEVKNVIKSQIREIEVIKTNIIKIDIGRGALENVFIAFADVTVPVKPDPESLRDALLVFLETSGGSLAKEEKQSQEVGLLTDLKTTVLTLQGLITSLDNKAFLQPSLVDNSGAGVVYKGYSAVGTLTTSPLWAIEKVRSQSGLETHTWADGNKNFDNIWNNRESLTYQ